jgi:hypothetical protein
MKRSSYLSGPDYSALIAQNDEWTTVVYALRCAADDHDYKGVHGVAQKLRTLALKIEEEVGV